jgi:hypothetical protein
VLRELVWEWAFIARHGGSENSRCDSVATGSDTCAGLMIFGLDGIETTLGSLRDQFPCALNIRYI